MASSEEEEGNRILKLESEEDRKILMKVKSEEGKILKLKKEYAAAALAGLFPPTVPTVMEAQPSGKKTKKVLVKRLVKMTKAQIDFVKAMVTHPCPTRNLTEDQLAEHPESFQYSYRQDIRIRNTRFAYLFALIDQQEKFGYAVDESEAEDTDDEGDDMVEVENY
jgi:hypothetical protein